jgi:serine/threonine-protein kinase
MTEILPRLAAALADRYRIERELGAGGMATVYLAEDLKHQRKVAVKVLRPELAAALGHERFLREITTTANLRHPHILPLYDSGEAGEFLFYVMPYAEGETLRERLDREKQLPLDDALRIAGEVADALSYAHSRGVIHRDIKPENILLESGHAVVADFGIARAVSAAGGDQLTKTGVAVGTAAYMSPEQAAGDEELDGRSDLYALGCVLYEMLAGLPPFTGPTFESLTRQHLTAEPRPITQLRPAVPAEVAAALERALAKTPADRFNPVAQFGDAIRPGKLATGASAVRVPKASGRGGRIVRLSVAVATLALIAVAVTVAVSRRGSGGESIAASVAVLPFIDLSAGRTSAYLGDGIAETLISALANVEGLEVAARTSAFSFRDKNEDVREIGRELGVATVLEGSVQRAGERLRVTAQLVKTEDGLHLWSQTFDREVHDIFAVQDEVAGAVVSALQGRLLVGQEQNASGTRDPAAYDAYLQGRFFWNKRAVSDLELAIEYFEEAIALDSTYAQAWAGLADAYLMLPFYSDTISSAQAVPRSRRAAERALMLNADLPEAHTTLAYALAIYDWDWQASEREFRRAIALDPNYATAHKWYRDVLTAMGRYEEALAAARRAADLDPRSPNVRTIVAISHWVLGQEEEALSEFERALELDPTFPLTLMHVSWFHWVRGDTARYFAARERLDAVSERGGVSASALRQAYAAGGPDSVLHLQVEAPGARLKPVDRAKWHVLLGDLDAAFLDLEQAERERSVWLPIGTTYPYMAPLRADPRYAATRERMGLP